MTILETIKGSFNTVKGWVGLGPKVAPTEKIVSLPNGRRAVVDEAGNFLRFERE